MKKWSLLIVFFYIFSANLHADILLNEDFEYDRNADTIQDIIMLSDKKWDVESQDGSGKIRVTSEYAHSGVRSARFKISTGKPTRLRHKANYSNNFYIEFWIRPDPATNESDNNKLIYFLDDYGQVANNSCVKVSHKSHWLASRCSNQQFYRLLDKGWAIHYLGPGCATKRVGLYSDKVKVLRYDVWNRVILHYRKSGEQILIECWIDNGNGKGLEKSGDNMILDHMECYNTRVIGGMDFGDMSGRNYSIFNLDDIKVTTSKEDIEW